MNALARQNMTDWAEANKAFLSAEFTRLRALLGDGDLADAQTAVAQASDAMPGAASIDLLARLFGLSSFEREITLLLAAIEMDARTSQIVGGRISFATALALFEDAHWSALSLSEPLRYWRMVHVDPGAGLTAAALRLDERILHFLAGVAFVDPALRAILTPAAMSGLTDADQARKAAETIAALNGSGMLQLYGSDRDGQRDVAALVAAGLGLSPFVLRAADVPVAAADRQHIAIQLNREARLSALAYVIDPTGSEIGGLSDFLARLDGFVALPGAPVLAQGSTRLRIDLPEPAGQMALWRAALGDNFDAHGALIDRLSGQFRLSAREIERAATQLVTVGEDAALAELGANRKLDLGALAEEIPACAGWNDLVLPPAQLGVLEQIATHLRLRRKVHEDWGFAAKSARGLGMAALFWGGSGTGKTLAAEVLAAELGLPLYRIDLASVVSKYIGETEKNLSKVFEAAEASGAILLFDEADALFGKRSEVKDSHDRYANIEVSYLLQRMESYRGLAILTTNSKDALDTAFLRRLRFVVQFPFPDAAMRAAIWAASFPGDMPTSGVEIAKLAQLSVAGGTIRNIVLNAAFLAADENEPVAMRHFQKAAHLEAAKRESALSAAETRGWV